MKVKGKMLLFPPPPQKGLHAPIDWRETSDSCSSSPTCINAACCICYIQQSARFLPCHPNVVLMLSKLRNQSLLSPFPPPLWILWVMSATGWELKQLTALHLLSPSKHCPAPSSWRVRSWKESVYLGTKATFMPNTFDTVRTQFLSTFETNKALLSLISWALLNRFFQGRGEEKENEYKIGSMKTEVSNCSDNILRDLLLCRSWMKYKVKSFSKGSNACLICVKMCGC